MKTKQKQGSVFDYKIKSIKEHMDRVNETNEAYPRLKRKLKNWEHMRSMVLKLYHEDEKSKDYKQAILDVAERRMRI